MTTELSILIAEDEEIDVILLKRAFKDAGLDNSLHVVRDGLEALDYLEQTAKKTAPDDRLPALFILDVNMPRRTGLEVLRDLRGKPFLRTLPVMIFSSSAHPRDIEQAYHLGANAYVVKPHSIGQRNELARVIKNFWLQANRPPLIATDGYEATRRLHADVSFDGPLNS